MQENLINGPSLKHNGSWCFLQLFDGFEIAVPRLPLRFGSFSSIILPIRLFESMAMIFGAECIHDTLR